MPRYGGASTSPYAVTWRGAIRSLAAQRGTLSCHKRLELANRAAKRQRDALLPLFGGRRPMFIFQVIDRRSGEVLQTYH